MHETESAITEKIAQLDDQQQAQVLAFISTLKPPEHDKSYYLGRWLESAAQLREEIRAHYGDNYYFNSQAILDELRGNSVTNTLNDVFQTIRNRQQNPKAGSYTNSLLDAGIDEITKKVGEEAIEVIIAAQHQGQERLISEMADLTYHCLVLLAQQGLTPQHIADELAKRHQIKP